MPSNLECLGLGVADQAELERLLGVAVAAARPLGEVDGVSVLRWEDPSGARLIMSMQGGQLLDLLPSYAGTPGAQLANVRVASDEVAFADVMEGDEQVTMLALELEQRRLLPAEGVAAASATVVALGVDVTVHADEEAFAASDASLLQDPGEDGPGEPPPHFAEQGWSWPPRMAAESFISYGVFGAAEDAQAYARLIGTVQHARRLRVDATGQDFLSARVRTAGFEVDLCLPPGEHNLQPGNVIGGTVFLVGSLA
ncbi:MAG: hypothetical protein ACM30G_19645 [Micromonosporaceae bacterium]